MLKRLSNETEEQYIFRCCQNKDILDMTWDELGQELNKTLGKNIKPDTYRRRYQNFNQVWNNGAAHDESVHSELIALQKERQKLSDERAEYKRQIREEARKESYLELIKNIISENVSPVPYIEVEHPDTIENTSLIVHLTDIHAGIDINNYFNIFNKDVLKQRISEYVDKIAEIAYRHHATTCNIICSELVSGIIHENLRIQNNMDLIQSFKFVSDVIVKMLISLNKCFDKISVYTVQGNHSRISPKKEDSLNGENIDVLLPFYLSARLQNYSNIYIDNTNPVYGIARFEVLGNMVMASHGDKDTIENVVNNFTLLFNNKPDLVYLGHRHVNAFNTVYNTKVIQSGCISGTDEYALDIRKANYAEQTVSVITEDGLDCIYDVTLQ